MSDLKKYIAIYIFTFILTLLIYSSQFDTQRSLIENHFIASSIYVSIIFIFTFYYNFTNMIDLAWASLGFLLICVNMSSHWIKIIKQFSFSDSVVLSLGLLTISIYSMRHIILYVMFGFHGIDKKYEDFRYKDFEAKFNNLPRFLYWIANYISLHIIPILILSSCFMPIFNSIQYLKDHKVNNPTVCCVGFIITYISMIFENAADFQLHQFRNMKKQDKANGKKVINIGIWKYSRHPNYLGEIGYFWSLFIVYYGTTGQINYNIIGPILMTCIFVFYSAPAMDEYLTARYKEEYIDYKKKVNAFIPYIY